MICFTGDTAEQYREVAVSLAGQVRDELQCISMIKKTSWRKTLFAPDDQVIIGCLVSHDSEIIQVYTGGVKISRLPLDHYIYVGSEIGKGRFYWVDANRRQFVSSGKIVATNDTKDIDMAAPVVDAGKLLDNLFSPKKDPEEFIKLVNDNYYSLTEELYLGGKLRPSEDILAVGVI